MDDDDVLFVKKKLPLYLSPFPRTVHCPYSFNILTSPPLISQAICAHYSDDGLVSPTILLEVYVVLAVTGQEGSGTIMVGCAAFQIRHGVETLLQGSQIFGNGWNLANGNELLGQLR